MIIDVRIITDELLNHHKSRMEEWEQELFFDLQQLTFDGNTLSIYSTALNILRNLETAAEIKFSDDDLKRMITRVSKLAYEGK